jgi:hypothetical protein
MKLRGLTRIQEERPYADIVRDFAATGASLIRQSTIERYHGAVPQTTRLLEPGFIPPDRPARVLIISYFPNASDTYKPGTPAYEQTRKRFETWGRSGDVVDYRACYEDWLELLKLVRFHKQRTEPILEAARLKNDDFAWLPFVKAPMQAGSSPGDDVLDYDKDATWAQLQLLKPQIVWIQGVKVAERVIGLVKERITDRILPVHSLSQYGTSEKRAEDQAKIVSRLAQYLEETSLSPKAGPDSLSD